MRLVPVVVVVVVVLLALLLAVVLLLVVVLVLVLVLVVLVEVVSLFPFVAVGVAEGCFALTKSAEALVDLALASWKAALAFSRLARADCMATLFSGCDEQ